MILDRTFHPDEANQAFTVGRLLETGHYTYQPTDHHGPTLYYAAAPLQRAFGHTSTATLDGTLLRCTPLIFAVMTLVLGFLAVRRLAGRISAGLVLLLLLGTSPMFVFFATDFIQEMLLAAFTMLMFFAGCCYAQPGRRLKPGTWALIFGIAAGLAFATKETCVLTFAAAGIALLAQPSLLRGIRPNHAILSLLGFLLTAVLFYSSFGEDFHGVYNAFVAAPLSYLNRASGAAAAAGADWHVHPWWQYLEWLFMGKTIVTHEPFHIGATMPHLMPGISILATLPLLLSRRFRQALPAALRKALGFTVLYTLLLLMFYSCIPYKTPWCSLQILVGYMTATALTLSVWGELCAHREFYNGVDRNGPFVNWSVRWMPALIFLPWAVCIVTVDHLKGLHDIWRDPDSRRIPYNYAHSSPEVKQLAACVAEAVRKHDPQQSPSTGQPANAPFIAVALPPPDTWPFPWYNREFEHLTGYWTKFEDLVELERTGARPTVVIVPMTEGHLVQPLFPHLKNTKRFFMRPGVRVRVFW